MARRRFEGMAAGDWVMLGFGSVMALVITWLIVWGVQAMSADDVLRKQQEAREQQFAQQFYTRCQNDGGMAQTNYDGYVCWKGNGILFAFPEGNQQSDDNPKG